MSRPWLPLYVADYLRDTRRLTTQEHGAYLLLIMEYWTAGALPDDDRQLARITGLTIKQWTAAKTAIAGFFHDGWKHKRIDAELARAAEISSKRAASAKQKRSNSSANAPANAEHLDTHARASSQPQSQSQEDPPSGEARKRATRLDANWWPSVEDVTYAQSKGLSEQRISTESEKFRNYWTAKGGKDAAKLDWHATWQNWILKAMESGNGSVHPRRQSLVERGHELAEQARQLERAAGIERADDPVRGH